MKIILDIIDKKFPKFFMFIHLCIYILKKERKMFWFFLKNTISYYILKNKSDVVFKFKWNQIILPRNLNWLDWFIEVRSDRFYDKIKWYNNVLDLWWYVWDSALKFSENNNKVSVYEAHPENFEYLLKNTKNKKNISAYNYAVVWNKKDGVMKIYWWGFNMSAWNWLSCKNRDFVEIPTISILEILKNEKFDALKMDIEGAEYDCFDALIHTKEDNFLFKKWFIEFHLWNNKELNLKNTQDIIDWLIHNKGYSVKYFDVINNKYFESLDALKSDIFLVYFFNTL